MSLLPGILGSLRCHPRSHMNARKQSIVRLLSNLEPHNSAIPPYAHSNSFSSSSRLSTVDKSSEAYVQDPHHLTRKLASNLHLPLFSASGSQLQLLSEPAQFYQTLKHKISEARSRIFLASLYIGKEEKELISCLHSALRSNPDLEVTILVDALRSTREAPPSASCASLVASLQRDYPNRVEVRLYHTPNLKGLTKRLVGKRFNEGWGLQHMKIYGFDDDVILSGANLSRDYFTNRQDRYLSIEKHKEVSDFLYQLIKQVGRFSYKLIAIEDANHDREARAAYSAWKMIWDASDVGHGKQLSEKDWSREAFTSLEEFTSRWQARITSSSASQADGDTKLLPLLQMGPLGIRQETKAVPELLGLAQHTSRISSTPAVLELTSGYFSLYEPYKALLTQIQRSRSAITKIICAAPEANGFFKSRGVSGWIPEAYTFFEQKFWSALKRSGRLLGQDGRSQNEGGVEIREWKKEGWTYHAKGIWYTPPGGQDGPTMVHVGSSNYGSRSSNLDLECTLLISTTSKDLSGRLKQEVQTLQEDAKDVVNEQLFERPDRKVRTRVKIAAWFLKGML